MNQVRQIDPVVVLAFVSVTFVLALVGTHLAISAFWGCVAAFGAYASSRNQRRLDQL